MSAKETFDLLCYNLVRRPLGNVWLWLVWRFEGKPVPIRPSCAWITREDYMWAKLHILGEG